MEKPKAKLICDVETPLKSERVYDADEIDEWIEQEMAKKVWLDETTINQELLSRTSWFSDYQEGKVSQGWLRHKLAQAICSRVGEIMKGGGE